ncbi:MAG TPA: glycosyltransferase, partial [Pontibacter sp.]
AQDSYNPVLKKLLAKGVRTIENLTAPTIAHFFLAEQSYADELPFIGNRFTIVENKYKPTADYKPRLTPVQLNSGRVRLLYSGTISRIYGIFEAIALADTWHRQKPNVTLTIIGYCAHEPTLQQLRQTIADKPYITIVGGGKLVPHPEILQAIATHDIGLLPYQPNESTFRCIPTKLYEYMAYGLPILMQHNPLWNDILSAHSAGLSIDFNNYSINNLESEFYSLTFYSTGIPETAFWNSEEDRLLQAVTLILNRQQ